MRHREVKVGKWNLLVDWRPPLGMEGDLCQAESA